MEVMTVIPACMMKKAKRFVVRKPVYTACLICIIVCVLYITNVFTFNRDAHSNSICTSGGCILGPGSLYFHNHHVELKVSGNEDQISLKAKLGVKFENFSNFEVHHFNQNRGIRFVLPEVAEARITFFKHLEADCLNVSWSASRCKCEVFMDCFDIGSAHWYGGGELKNQQWPLEKVNLSLAPFIAGKTYGAVQERFFFNSKGGGIFVDEDIPLFVSVNANGDNQICLEAKIDHYWYFGDVVPELKYTMCSARNVRQIHEVMSDLFIEKPTSIPNENVFRFPIWSTWAQYKDEITQDLVMSFVRDIRKFGFSISQFEIDDGWSATFGEMVFNNQTFPNPLDLTTRLHNENIAVTLWVHPMINAQTQTFSYLAEKGWMMKDMSGVRPALTSWHKHLAGHIDFSNPNAAEWFLKQLESLKSSYGVDSFKFDIGDVNLLPPVFAAKKPFLNRNHYARFYVLTAQRSDPVEKRLELRTGVKTQRVPAFLRLLDRHSTWSTEKRGLRSVLSAGLQFGILGYPFLLPDYIGGNIFKYESLDPELFIRWIQANALMPVMQFSLAPWKSNNKTVTEVGLDMVKLHEKYSDLIISLAKEAVETGYPIMRPLWWIAPTDEAALVVDDQFLVGDGLMVAPVLEQGQTTRKIYLPVGRWRDELKGRQYDGEQWLIYPVTLRDLPHFTKLS